jgi:uncharacterized membrane protein
MLDNKQELFTWINNNKGKFIGLIAGFIFGLLILLIGILKTIVIFLFALIGLYVGHLWDGGKNIPNILKKINRN